MTSFYEEVLALRGRLPAGADLEAWSTISGHEPDSLFYNLGGRQFADLSGISGIDTETDGRVVAVWDYDRDGWPDLAVANANAPLLRIFRNRIGDRSAGRAGFLALRVVGSNGRAQADRSRSARDACGARVEVFAAGRTRVLEMPCGGGFASQNSRTLLVGLGGAAGADWIRVRWPSGTVRESGPVPAGALVTAYEHPRPPGADAFSVIDYRPATGGPRTTVLERRVIDRR